MLTVIGPLAAAVWKWVSAVFMAVISTPLGAGAVVAVVLLVWNARIDNPRVAREATAGCLSTVETAALKAQIDLERQRRAAPERALAGYRRLAADDAAAAEAEAEDLQKRIADYEKQLADAGRGCRLDDADLDWLHDNRRKPESRR
jgi:hypothetical protein